MKKEDPGRLEAPLLAAAKICPPAAGQVAAESLPAPRCSEFRAAGLRAPRSSVIATREPEGAARHILPITGTAAGRRKDAADASTDCLPIWGLASKKCVLTQMG